VDQHIIATSVYAYHYLIFTTRAAALEGQGALIASAQMVTSAYALNFAYEHVDASAPARWRRIAAHA